MDPHHSQREEAFADSARGSRPDGQGGWTSGGSAGQVSAEQADANNVLRQCVLSLLENTKTARVVRELINASLTSTTSESADSVGVSRDAATAATAAAASSGLSSSNATMMTANATFSASTPASSSSTGGLYNATNSSNLMSLEDFGDLELSNMARANPSWRLNLFKLGKLLPATESIYQLEALSERWQYCLVIIYSLTAITSFILNVITVIVLYRGQRSELRKYLMNLSLSDLLMSLFSIPFTYTEYMLGHWVFASFLCPVVRFVVTLSVFVSVATMTVIGINRYVAIMYPLKGKRRSKIRHWAIRRTHVIVGIWLLGIAISLPEYLMFSAEPFCYNKQLYYECRCSWLESISNSYTIFIYLSTFIIPLSVLTYLYTCICLKLWHRQMPGNVDVNRDLTMQTKRAKVVKMLLMVVIFFAAFWLPLQTFSMVMFLYPEIRAGFVYQSIAYNIFIGTYFACHWLSMAHSCLNSLIYCFMNEKFRADLNNLICGLRGVSAANRSIKGQLSGYSTSYSTSITGSKIRAHHYSLNHKPQSVQDFQQHQHQQQQQQGQAVARQMSNSVRIKFRLDCDCQDETASRVGGNPSNGQLGRRESSEQVVDQDENGQAKMPATDEQNLSCKGNGSGRTRPVPGRGGGMLRADQRQEEGQQQQQQRRQTRCRRKDSACPIGRIKLTRAGGGLVGGKHRNGSGATREGRDHVNAREADTGTGASPDKRLAGSPMDPTTITSSSSTFIVNSSTTDAALPCNRFYRLYNTGCNVANSNNINNITSDKTIATNDIETLPELSEEVELEEAQNEEKAEGSAEDPKRVNCVAGASVDSGQAGNGAGDRLAGQIDRVGV